MQTITRTAAKLVTAAAILFSAMPIAAAAAESPTAAAAPITQTSVDTANTAVLADFQAAAKRRPTYIAGYTDHARQRMALRNISEMQVQDVISSHNNGVWQPDRQTWKVCWNSICVAINDDAYIVTVF